MMETQGLVRSLFRIFIILTIGGCSHPVDFGRMPASASSSVLGLKDESKNFVIDQTEETFFPGVRTKKKIDLLMLVDNSGSMGDDQVALANGFAAIAGKYFRNPGFDICISIITSDRYLGRVGANGYERERSVGCTNPDGSETWSQQQLSAHWDAIISDFQLKVNVGTQGSSRELVGKSLATFLYHQDAWSSNLNTTQLNSFFRPDAVANISVFTDENNYFYNGMDPGEINNDIPSLTNTTAPGGAVDRRRGVKDYLDDYFSRLAGISLSQLNYSVLAMLRLSVPLDRSENMYRLVDDVGRASSRQEISGDSSVYESVYDTLLQELINQASAIKLSYAYYEPGLPEHLSDVFQVTLNANQVLQFGTDFTLVAPNQVRLSDAIARSLTPQNPVKVRYQYLR